MLLTGPLMVVLAASLAELQRVPEAVGCRCAGANVDLKISVLDAGETPSDNKVIVVMQFFQDGTVVRWLQT
jgi:hypothetical protein